MKKKNTLNEEVLRIRQMMGLNEKITLSELRSIVKRIIKEESNSLKDHPQIKILKKGDIKVGFTKEPVYDDVYQVLPDVKISVAQIDPNSLNYDKYYYRSEIIVTDTDEKKYKSMNIISNSGMVSGDFYYGDKRGRINKSKLRDISRNILIFSKETHEIVDTINLNTYKVENHDENGNITLPDNVARVYKNKAVKTYDDASVSLGGKLVFRQGGKGLNKKDNEELYKNWEDKIAQVGKYKWDKYGDMITKDKRYFEWFLQNTTYYEPSPETKYDIPTAFNINLYHFLKDKGLL